MRLIDADELLKDLESMGTETDNIGRYIDMMMLYECRNIVKNQPTAYDVEKVVEELKSIASHAIYIELYYMYCDNCRFRSEIGEEESRNQLGYWACEDCYRKYNGWAISKEVADKIADIIVEEMREETNEQTNNQK